MSKKSHKKNLMAGIIIFFGLLFLMAGLYLLPLGTDIFLWFFVVVVAHGDWVFGDILANLAAVAMIIFGLVLLHHEGVRPGVKKVKKK